MDHVWPNLQRHSNICRASPCGDLDRIVEHGLGTTDLDEQRRQTLEIGVKWGGKRCPRGFPAKIPAGQFQYVFLADDWIDRRLGDVALAWRFHVDPGRETPATRRQRQAALPQSNYHGEGQS